MTGPTFSDTVQREQPAPRRAALCGAKLRQQRDDGRTTCHHEAGWGTDHPGVGACKVHAGATPNGRKAAQTEQARQLLGTLGVVADPTSLPAPVVHAELQLSAAKQLAAVRYAALRAEPPSARRAHGRAGARGVPAGAGGGVSSRLACWLHGHQWGPWDRQVWSNVLGTSYRVRWCDQCGAMDRKGA